jgi:hypothetical protein
VIRPRFPFVLAAAAAFASPAAAQLPTARTVLLDETIAGADAGPFTVVLDSTSVYRVDVAIHREGGTARATLGTVRSLESADVSIAPHLLHDPPGLIRLPLSTDGSEPNSTSVPFFPRTSGAYRIDASAPIGTLLRIRVLWEAGDNLEWACIRAHGHAPADSACAALHTARRPVLHVGPLPVAVALLLPVLALVIF